MKIIQYPSQKEIEQAGRRLALNVQYVKNLKSLSTAERVNILETSYPLKRANFKLKYSNSNNESFNDLGAFKHQILALFEQAEQWVKANKFIYESYHINDMGIRVNAFKYISDAELINEAKGWHHLQHKQIMAEQNYRIKKLTRNLVSSDEAKIAINKLKKKFKLK